MFSAFRSISWANHFKDNAKVWRCAQKKYSYTHTRMHTYTHTFDHSTAQRNKYNVWLYYVWNKQSSNAAIQFKRYKCMMRDFNYIVYMELSCACAHLLRWLFPFFFSHFIRIWIFKKKSLCGCHFGCTLLSITIFWNALCDFTVWFEQLLRYLGRGPKYIYFIFNQSPLGAFLVVRKRERGCIAFEVNNVCVQWQLRYSLIVWVIRRISPPWGCHRYKFAHIRSIISNDLNDNCNAFAQIS